MNLKLFLALFLTCTCLSKSADTNSYPVKIIVIVLTNTNQLPSVIKAITNEIPSTVISYKIDPRITQLTTQIKLMEKRFEENYKGVPTNYIGDGSQLSQSNLDRLIEVWKQKEVDLKEIDRLKLELEKLTK